MRKAIFLATFIFALTVKSLAQYLSNIDNKTELFLYEVKTIDEFIERFNDDLGSFIRHEYAKANKPFNVTRPQLMVSLFNQENKSWVADTTLNDFILKASDPAHPQFLFFTDSNWYAEASCNFTFKGKPLTITLILHIRTEKNKGSKWMIVGVKNNSIFDDGGEVGLTYKTEYLPNTQYISTSSHAINFVELANVFQPAMNANYFFEPWVLNNKKVKHFIALVLENKLKFNFVSNIKYHFYQLPERIFIVEHYERHTLNSGWLINNVAKVTDQEKDNLLKKLLQN